MRRALGFIVGTIVALAAVLGLGALASPKDPPAKVEPAALSPVDGTDRWRITLIESAAERLDIQTASVEAAEDGRLAVPSAAVIITPDGSYWVYTESAPLTYERQELVDVVEQDSMAYFASGPPSGTSVVVTGVPELYGTEFGIGK